MNASLRGENPKQCSFLCLIYVNHESFHKWNKRYCERLVLPGRAHPGSPTQSILYLTASARTGEHAPRHFFFPWAPTFLLIASVPCGATVHTLPETSSQVMPAAHCHISSSPDYSSTAHERWREGGCLGLWVVSGNKRRGIVGPAAQQKLSQCYSEKKNIRELSRIKSLEKEPACKMDDLSSSDMVYVISKI